MKSYRSEAKNDNARDNIIIHNRGISYIKIASNYHNINGYQQWQITLKLHPSSALHE